MTVSDLMVVVPWAVFAVAAIAAGIILTRPPHESRQQDNRPSDPSGPQPRRQQRSEPEDRPTARAP